MTLPYRPMPENFAEDAKGLTVRIIRMRWKCSTRMALRWRKESGLYVPHPEKMLRMPEGFAKNALGKTVRALSLEYGHDEKVIRRWRKEAGMGKPSRLPVIPVEKLRELGETMILTDIAALYKTSLPSMRRIFAAAGVKYQTRVVKKPAQKVANLPSRGSPYRPVLNATAQYAKDWIQEREPIWRCREDGVYDFTGAWFRFRSKTWDAAALVKKAREMGWSETRAWSVAA